MVKELIDFILAKYFNAPNLELQWKIEEQEQDPLQKAQYYSILVNSGILSREKSGKRFRLLTK
jgi:hypothetical protein